MQSFTDSQKHQWTLSLTYGDVQKIKAQLGADLLKPPTKEDDSPVVRLMIDIEFVVGIGWILCEKQASTLGVSPDDFAARLGGAALGELRAAVIAELVDFFRSLGRTEMAEAVLKFDAGLQTVIAAATRRIDENLTKAMNEALTT